MSIAEKLQTIAQNEQKVFDAGKKAAYDAFWDDYQQNGNRSNYLFGFSGGGWTPQNFKPKYKCTPTNANSMFYLFGYGNNQPNVDFRGYADKFDFSKVANASSAFYSAALDYITADFSSATNLSYAFYCGYTSRFTTLTIKMTPVTTSVTQMFGYAHTLTNLTFTDDSEIACDGLNLSACTGLTTKSISSVIGALSPNTDGLTVTFSKTAVNKAFDDEIWIAVKDTKPNWNIITA